MKYVLVIGDGMAGFPVEELSGKAPLQAAKKAVIARLAGQGLVGEVRTVPRGVPARCRAGRLEEPWHARPNAPRARATKIATSG